MHLFQIQNLYLQIMLLRLTFNKILLYFIISIYIVFIIPYTPFLTTSIIKILELYYHSFKELVNQIFSQNFYNSIILYIFISFKEIYTIFYLQKTLTTYINIRYNKHCRRLLKKYFEHNSRERL
jgi:hypothetical protein